MATQFFTKADPDLTAESSVDPMGIQIIWTHYGQNIFGERLTTIANDLRVFTFNLFHNHLINRLYQDFPEEVQEAKRYYKTWQTESDVKAGLLIFLEDLVTHVFYNHDGADADKLGILGMSKARMIYNSTNPDNIVLAANKRLGILKNQLNLGMTGRYKGPMMNMGFFDRSFSYIPKTWDHVNLFMNRWQEAMQLQEDIIMLIRKDLLECNKREYPFISLKELRSLRLWKAISSGYVSCFGSRKLPKYIRNYWQDKLGLNSGAPNALFTSVSDFVNKDIEHDNVFKNALKLISSEPLEAEKIKVIIALEPFLSHSEYLLRYLAQPSIKNLTDEMETIEMLRAEIAKSSKFDTNSTLPARLSEMYSVMTQTSLSTADWLRGVLAYHKRIMESRGGNMWLELDEKNNFKHYFAPILPEHSRTADKYLDKKPWYHTYYLETLKSIRIGLN